MNDHSPQPIQIIRYDTPQQYPCLQSSIYDTAIIAYQNPASLQLVEIDPYAVEFKELLGEMKDLTVRPSEYNELIDASIEQLQKEAYIFLDIAVCNALMMETSRIPRSWWDLVDSDASGGSVGFYGTQLARADQEKFVLAPFVAHGQWTVGYVPLHFSSEEIASFEAQEVIGISRSATVYRIS